MTKNEIFTFTAPNGAEVTGVVVFECPCYKDMEGHWEQYIIYAQNRIAFWNFNVDFPDRSRLGGILIDYAILPEYDRMLEAAYDEMLEDYYHQLDLADDYADKTL